MQHFDKLDNVIFSNMCRGVFFIDANLNSVNIVINNTNRTDEEVDAIAREVKVQLIMVMKEEFGVNADVTVKYKGVNDAEYTKYISGMLKGK